MIMDRSRYILDGADVVPVDDLMIWAAWMETSDVSVAFDRIGDGIVLSTVFLGLDHSFPRMPTHPVVFETAIFKGREIVSIVRSSTFDQAVAAHAAAYADPGGGL